MFEDIIAKLEDRPSKKIGNNTYLQRHGGSVKLLYHDTYVAHFLPDRVILSSGKWRTSTTKERITWAFGMAKVPITLCQEDGIWYLGKHCKWRVFFDGIEISYNGQFLSSPKLSIQENDREKLLLRGISAYCREVRKLLEEQGAPLPNSGDCWFCYFETEKGVSLGDITNNTDHLESHLEEGYIHGSILYNAVRDKGYRLPELILGYGGHTIMVDSVVRAVRAYFKKRLALGR